MRTLNKFGHYWAFCTHCDGPMVICGNCGNNCCNGGSGEYDDGSKCQICLDAYDFQALGQGDRPLIDLSDRPEPMNPDRWILRDRAMTPEEREEEQRLLRELWESDPFAEALHDRSSKLSEEDAAALREIVLAKSDPGVPRF